MRNFNDPYWKEKRHQRIINTKKILEEFAKENLPAETAAEVLDILSGIPNDDAPEDKNSTESAEDADNK